MATAQTPPGRNDGLSVTLWADIAAVTMGAAIDFHVSLVFDTTKANPKTRILNRDSQRCEFVFVSDASGESFERLPYSTGMLRMVGPGNLVRLTHGARIVLDDLKVYLVSEEGQQIPPGTYSVRVAYVNDSGDKEEAYIDSTGQYGRRRYAGPWEIWSGRAESTAFALKVLPASSALVEVEIPAALVVDTTTIQMPTEERGVSPLVQTAPPSMQIAWAFSQDSTQVIRVMQRPGFTLGTRWTLESLVDGETISDYPRGGGSVKGRGDTSYLHPDVSSRLWDATDSELVLHMEVFEASTQPKHAWEPERGEFKVLWTGEIRYKFQRGSR